MQNTNTIVTVSVVALLAIASGAYLFRRKKRVEHPPKTWKLAGKVSKLHIFPLKSGRRIELQTADCSKWGISQSKEEEEVLQLRDRCLVVYSESNHEFKTARTFPKMVLIEVSVHDGTHVAFDAPGMRSLYVKLPEAGQSTETTIKLHKGEEIYSIDCGDEAAQWISRYIHGKPEGLRIGFHDANDAKRRNIEKIHPIAKKVYKNFRNDAGGLYPDFTALLLVNEASVDDLNTRTPSETKITTEHFRPTITVTGAPAFSEDDWDWLKIGDAIFRNVKPCTRCMMTTIDPETGIRNENREPLKSLETYRKMKAVKGIDYEGNLTVMGIHLGVIQGGIIKLDDEVFVG